MADFKINDKSVFTQSGSDEPVLASNVTGGGGLTALGTVASGTLSSGVTLPDRIGDWKPLGQIKLTTATDKVYFVHGLAPQGDDGRTYTSVASTVVWDTTYPLYKLNYFINNNYKDNINNLFSYFHISISIKI